MPRGTGLRVLLLLHDLGIGGAQTSVLHLARELAALGCKPLVCAWRRGGVLEARLAAHAVPATVIGSRARAIDRFRVARALHRRARAHRTQLVHAHLSDAAVFGAWLARTRGIPCVLTHHGPDLIEGVAAQRPAERRLRRFLLGLSARACAHEIAVSETVAEHVRRSRRIAPDRLSVIPNGVPLHPDAAVERQADARAARFDAGFGREGPLVVCVSRLVAAKDPGTLLEAAPAILAAHPHAQIRFLGDGPERERLVARAAALGITGNVRFEGAVADVDDWLARADVLVAPSPAEGAPLSLIEAMARGVPIVASDAAAHREILGEGDCAERFRAGDPGDLAAALGRALAQPAAARLRAKLALARVRERYASDVVARSHLALYERVVAERRMPAAPAS
jgi:glycosyltransferase involved in cell wall biosynthesis